MKHNSHQFHCGLKDGAPIGLGYLAASFILGIMARGAGLTVPQPVVMSSISLISVGQFAVLGIIQAGILSMGMAMAQLTINLCYCLMSRPSSQKLSVDIPLSYHFSVSYGVMDRIFGVSIRRLDCLSPFYNYGPICIAAPGWTLGTLLGAISRELFPTHPLGTLNVALYGMFLTVVIPPAKVSRTLIGVIPASMALSLVPAHVSFLVGLPSGFKIILLTILIVGAAAILFPVEGGNEYES